MEITINFDIIIRTFAFILSFFRSFKRPFPILDNELIRLHSPEQFFALIFSLALKCRD